MNYNTASSWLAYQARTGVDTYRVMGGFVRRLGPKTIGVYRDAVLSHELLFWLHKNGDVTLNPDGHTEMIVAEYIRYHCDVVRLNLVGAQIQVQISSRNGGFSSYSMPLPPGTRIRPWYNYVRTANTYWMPEHPAYAHRQLILADIGGDL